MKRFLKFSVLAVLAVCMLAIAVCADNVAIDYRFEEVDGKENIVTLTLNSKTDFPVDQFTTIFSFDKNVMLPVDTSTGNSYTPNKFTYDKNWVSMLEINGIGEAEGVPLTYDKTIVYFSIPDENTFNYDISVTSPENAPYFPYSAGMDVWMLTFELQNGKTLEDLKTAGFALETVYFGEDNSMENTYGWGTDQATYEFTPTITFPEVAVPVTSIDVPAGSSVYMNDGTRATYEAATKVDVDVETEGYIVVNTGYTAQTTYKVADGTVTKIDALDNALLGSDYTEIRTNAPEGLRFRSSITDESRLADDIGIKEYGYLVTVESAKMNLGNDYHLDFDLVNAGKAISKAAYIEGTSTNIIWAEENDMTIFTGVAHGIPETRAGYTTVIAARPYYKMADGTVVYGKMTRSSVNDTCKELQALANANAITLTAEQQAYITKVTTIVGATTTEEVKINVSDLWAE